MSLQLDEHREYLSDRFRVEALRQAIHATVRPGDIVLDLGCGTGVLGLFACEAGAGRVYAIDSTGMIEMARAIARANGVADRITHIGGYSTHVDLPERADVLVFDQIGRLGFEAGLLEFARDARRRLLQPGARIVPGPVRLSLALAACPGVRERMEFWNTAPAGIDISSARITADNTGYPVDPEELTLLSPSAEVLTLDPASWDGESLDGRVRLRASSRARVDGVAGWFVAELSPGVFMTNAPDRADRINRRAAFLPLAAPLDLEAGEELDVALRLLPEALMLSWDVARPDGSGRQLQSTWKGMLPTREILTRTRDGAVPVLTARGAARKSVLDLCDGTRRVDEIEQALFERHRDLFASPSDAAVFAAEVLSVYSQV